MISWINCCSAYSVFIITFWYWLRINFTLYNPIPRRSLKSLISVKLNYALELNIEVILEIAEKIDKINMKINVSKKYAIYKTIPQKSANNVEPERATISTF